MKRRGRKKKRVVTLGDAQAIRKAEIKAKTEREEKAPDATESVLQEMVRDLRILSPVYEDQKKELREEARRSHPDDGAIAAPLLVACRYAAKHLAEEGDDQDMLARWLCAQLGETIRDVDLSEFREWDAARRQRLAVV